MAKRKKPKPIPITLEEMRERIEELEALMADRRLKKAESMARYREGLRKRKRKAKPDAEGSE